MLAICTSNCAHGRSTGCATLQQGIAVEVFAVLDLLHLDVAVDELVYVRDHNCALDVEHYRMRTREEAVSDTAKLGAGGLR